MKLFLQSDIDEILEKSNLELNSLSGKNILLSGGNGFLGSYFTEVFHQFNMGRTKKNILKYYR